MADDMEQIEARLAAYIDGTLPDAQRVEIEAYLKANPAHAKLISELVSLKSAIASFPREKAPAEVLDTLQSQIERHALLDAEDEGDSSPMRITRWPAFGSAAAVALLAAGLGLLVYQVLPKPKSDLTLLATTRPGEVSLSDAGGATALREKDADAVTGVAKRSAAAKRAAAAKDEATTGSAGVVAGSMGGSGIGGMAGPVVPPSAVPSLAAPGTLSDAGRNQADAARERLSLNNAQGNVQSDFGMQQAAQNNTLTLNAPVAATPNDGSANFFASIRAAPLVSDPVRVVIVRSDDPALTQNLLVGSLVAEKIPFELADWPSGVRTELPATLPSVDEVVGRLRANGDLTPQDAQTTAARPMIVRGLRSDRADALRNTLDQQRPGRQHAVWAGRARAKTAGADAGLKDGEAKAEAASKPASQSVRPGAIAQTSPATRPDEAIAVMSDIEFEPRTGVLLDVRPSASQPTTSPASQPAAQTQMASDLVVLVLARPMPATVPATRPLPTTATTRP